MELSSAWGWGDKQIITHMYWTQYHFTPWLHLLTTIPQSQSCFAKRPGEERYSCGVTKEANEGSLCVCVCTFVCVCVCKCVCL